MKKHSIFTKINLFFAIFLFLLVTLFAGVFIVHKFKDGGDSMRRVHQYMHSLRDGYGADASSFELRVLDEKELEIIKTKTPHREFGRAGDAPRQMMMQDGKPDIPFDGRPPRHERIYEDDGVRYIVAQTLDGDVGLQDMASHTVFYICFWGAFALMLGGVTWLYKMIVNSLKPLRTLETEIREFGLNIKKPECAIGEPKDEISSIRQAFYDSSSKIASLMSAREIFLKNVAHELKTPIAKGVVVAHLVGDEKQQSRLVEIFARLNQIVESVRASEEISMDGFALDLQNIPVKRLCTDAARRALLGSEAVSLQMGDEVSVCADERLILIALSNLFENGVKFSDDARVECTADGTSICVKNKGAPLAEPLERYEEPFFKETSLRNSNGMGLGLYLTKKALDMQGMSLVYTHENGFNIFTIKLA